MPGAHHFQDQAYVLHSRAYRNTSLLIDVLTRQHGRLSMVAKGAKRGNSPLAGKLQPYQSLFIEWGGQNELVTLYKAETDSRSHQTLAGDALYHGFYLNELLMRLLHRHSRISASGLSLARQELSWSCFLPQSPFLSG